MKSLELRKGPPSFGVFRALAVGAVLFLLLIVFLGLAGVGPAAAFQSVTDAVMSWISTHLVAKLR